MEKKAVEKKVDKEFQPEEEEVVEPKAKKARKTRMKIKSPVEVLSEKDMSDFEAMSKPELLAAIKVFAEFAKEKFTPVEITQREIDRLIKTILSNIKSNLKWTGSCKHSGAKFSASALCTEELFKATFKTTTIRNSFPKEEFFRILGQDEVIGSARYNDLYIRDNLSVSYTRTTGVAKVTGTYGV